MQSTRWIKRLNQIYSLARWNGIAMEAIDMAKRHVTQEKHVDVGMRVAYYATIQDYFGETIIDTNGCRLFIPVL